MFKIVYDKAPRRESHDDGAGSGTHAAITVAVAAVAAALAATYLTITVAIAVAAAVAIAAAAAVAVAITVAVGWSHSCTSEVRVLKISSSQQSLIADSNHASKMSMCCDKSRYLDKSR